MTGTIKAGRATFHLTSEFQDQQDQVLSKDVNYKEFLGKKLVTDE